MKGFLCEFVFNLAVGIETHPESTCPKVNVSIYVSITPEDALEKAITPLLYPAGRPVTAAKFNDLMELIEFIAPQYRSFYERLQQDADIEDYGLASGDSDDE